MAVVHVEADQQQHIRRPHPGDVQSRSTGPAAPHGGSAEQGRGDRGGAEDEQEMVHRPTHQRQRCRRDQEREQTPEVGRSKPHVPARPLATEDDDGAGRHAGSPQRRVHGQDGEEERLGRRDDEAGDRRGARRHGKRSVGFAALAPAFSIQPNSRLATTAPTS
jgi:hypothetical protein